MLPALDGGVPVHNGGLLHVSLYDLRGSHMPTGENPMTPLDVNPPITHIMQDNGYTTFPCSKTYGSCLWWWFCASVCAYTVCADNGSNPANRKFHNRTTSTHSNYHGSSVSCKCIVMNIKEKNINNLPHWQRIWCHWSTNTTLVSYILFQSCTKLDYTVLHRLFI